MQVATVVASAQLDDGRFSASELITEYENGIGTLRKAVNGLTDEQVRCRPIPEKWSSLEVVCHLADTEQFFSERIKRTIAIDRPLLIGIDSSLYSDRLHYQKHEMSEELNFFELTRRQTVRTLKLVAADAWERTAVHSETGLVTVRQLLLHAINHLDHHLRFVDEKRLAMNNPPCK